MISQQNVRGRVRVSPESRPPRADRALPIPSLSWPGNGLAAESSASDVLPTEDTPDRSKIEVFWEGHLVETLPAPPAAWEWIEMFNAQLNAEGYWAVLRE